MIEIINVSFSYGHQDVLRNINLTLPNAGLITVIGPSGCGKSTLLNCISGLIKCSGTVKIDSQQIDKMSEEEKDDFRLKNIGLVFQDFKLFNSDTALNNIVFPMDCISNMPEDRKKQKARDLLQLVGLDKQEGKIVSNFSGGEKQRIAIARALINSPKIILADEPTGALDTQNSAIIMEILRKISNNCLVFAVSHDVELARKYSDQIIEMRDGIIEKISYCESRETDCYLPIAMPKIGSKKTSIPVTFLCRYSLEILKKKKWRTTFCYAITSLGLLGVGLSLTISRLISTNIKDAYSSIIGDNKIMVISKDAPSKDDFEPLELYEMEQLAHDNAEHIQDLGVYYANDFENMFADSNSLWTSSGAYKYKIDGISARSINEFEWLDFNEDPIYPGNINALKDDEIILGLNMPNIEQFCYALKIQRNITSFSEYLEKHKVTVFFSFENTDWGYYDEQCFTVKGFILQADPCIYHSNHLWNELIIENWMKFTDISKKGENNPPWALEKHHYIKLSSDKTNFLSMVKNNNKYDNYLFEIADSDDYPVLYRNRMTTESNRLFVYKTQKHLITKQEIEAMLSLNCDINNPILGSQSAYSIYPDNLMMGFSHPTIFASSSNEIQTSIDALCNEDLLGSGNYEFGNNMLFGHYSKPLQNSVIFGTFEGKLKAGYAPKAINEVLVSEKMYTKIFKEKFEKETLLKCGFCTSEYLYESNMIKREFRETELVITGIVDSPYYSIFNGSEWLNNYYQQQLGVSAFDLIVNAVSFDCHDQRKISKTIEEFSKYFPQYTFINPMNDVEKSINEVCFWMEIVLAAFSLIATSISILLLYMCCYLNAIENRKEIGLSRCIGVTAKESKKFVYYQTFITCIFSYLFACLELVIISIVSSYEISGIFSSNFHIEINPLSFIVMGVFCLVISYISSFNIASKVSKQNPLESVKR